MKMRMRFDSMKRMVAAGAAVVGVMASVATASAAGAFTTTTHVDSIHAAIPVACAGPGVSLINATGNGVQHLTVNGTGDWFTTTFAGEGTLMMVPPGTTYQGHVQIWFGSEDNNQNGVVHATLNFDGTNVADPSQILHLHAAFDVTVNANGVLTVNNFTVDCR
jgi:hypothetical protein